MMNLYLTRENDPLVVQEHPDWLTLVDVLQWRAQYQPNHLAFQFLVDGEEEIETITYQELDQEARAVAAQLQQMHLAGERVLMFYPSGLPFVTALMGCLYAGVIAVPAYPPNDNRFLARIQSMTQSANARAILTTNEVHNRLTQRFTETSVVHQLTTVITDTIPQQMAGKFRPETIAPESVAFLQYTSGSTAQPKGVIVTHGNIMANQIMIQRAFENHDQMTVGGWLPLFHDMGLTAILFQPLYLGVPSIFMSPVDFIRKPIRWLQAISRYKITTTGGPNFAYELCLTHTSEAERQGLDLSHWEVAFNGAEPVRQHTLQRFLQTFAPYGLRRAALFPCYGMAETTLLVSGQRDALTCLYVDGLRLQQNEVRVLDDAAPGSKPLVACGRTDWLDQEVLIVNPETYQVCPEDVVGEIWIAGSHVAKGYWNNPEATRETFAAYTANPRRGPFLRSGDLGFVYDGQLYVAGRRKDLIIIRGRNYYPQDIEQAVEQVQPAIFPSSVAAFSVDVADEEKLVVVAEVDRAYVPGLNAELLARPIVRAVSQKFELALHEIVFLQPTTLPKTSSGKLKRGLTRQKYLENKLEALDAWRSGPAAAAVSQVADAVGLQRQLEDEIQQWLAQRLEQTPHAIDKTTPLASFGLDSITVIELSVKLEKMIGQSIPETIIYDYPNIAELAAYLVKLVYPADKNGHDLSVVQEVRQNGKQTPGATKPTIALPRFAARRPLKGEKHDE